MRCEFRYYWRASFCSLTVGVVIQILQQNPVQNKPCMQADVSMRIVFHVRAKLQRLQLWEELVLVLAVLVVVRN